MVKNLLIAAGTLALGATSVHAGALERSSQSVAILFEPGSYAEFSIGIVNPDISGTGNGPWAGVSSGDIVGSYATLSFGYKQALSDKLDMAIILDQPVGGKISYPAANAPYPFAGSSAEVSSLAVTGLLRYKFPSHVSVYGGLRAESVKGHLNIVAPALSPAFTNYNLTAEQNYQLGYVLGVAWEKPEIAARVALTYNSSITHDFDTIETGLGPGAILDVMEVEIPQSVNLEFQSGIAANTLLFGSIRWVDWTAFQVAPNSLSPQALVSYPNDMITYNIGIGRKFNETWSGAVTVGYEKHFGDPVSNLTANDGVKSVGLAVTYTKDNMKITGGLRYLDIGDATTTLVGSSFSGNSGIAGGVRVGFNF